MSKTAQIIFYIVVAVILILFICGLFTSAPVIPDADVTAVTTPIITDLGTSGGDYTPTTVNIPPANSGNAGSNGSTAAAQPTVVTSAPLASPSYSPFNPAMYLANTGAANLLDANTINAWVQKLHDKMYVYLPIPGSTLLWSPDNTINSLKSDFTTQIQVSQLANAYKTAYAVDMYQDLQNNLSTFSKGKYFLVQLANAANALPLGY